MSVRLAEQHGAFKLAHQGGRDAVNVEVGAELPAADTVAQTGHDRILPPPEQPTQALAKLGVIPCELRGEISERAPAAAGAGVDAVAYRGEKLLQAQAGRPTLIAERTVDNIHAEPRGETVQHRQAELFFACKVVIKVAPAHTAFGDDVVEGGRLEPAPVKQPGRGLQNPMPIPEVSPHPAPAGAGP